MYTRTESTSAVKGHANKTTFVLKFVISFIAPMLLFVLDHLLPNNVEDKSGSTYFMDIIGTYLH